MEPFYMTYPMQNLFQAEMEYERDFDRMKAMYPKEVTKILLCVQDRCDELEYEGSRMFDEEPDRLMMEREIRNLYEKLRAEFEQSGEVPVPTEEESPQLQAFSLRPPEDWGWKEKPDVQGLHRREGCRDWLCQMVGVLFYNEVYKRRCRHRRCQRWW